MWFVRDLSGSSEGQTLLVEDDEGERAVLKTQDWPLDMLVRSLRAYADLGVPCPTVIDSGTEPTHWVIMTWETGQRPTVADARARLPDAMKLLARMHQASPIHQDEEWLRGYLADELYVYTHDHDREPETFPLHPETIARELSFSRPVQLHGDWHPVNTLLNVDCGWVALDPIGFLGPAEYDAAAWCVRGCGDPSGLLARLQQAITAYPALDKRQLALWAAWDCFGRARSSRGNSPKRWRRMALRLSAQI
ncbi:aminoglycoside phosphotransferase [Parafrankia sp. EAN1pec]|nr:aminoglycoside phosphotransferase [Frankia sp. EAN1pec]